MFVALNEQAVAFAQARRMAWAFTNNTEDITRQVKVEKLRVCTFGAFEPIQGVVEVPGFFTAVLDAVDITKVS